MARLLDPPGCPLTPHDLLGRIVDVLDERGRPTGIRGVVSPWLRHTAIGVVLEVSAAGRRVEVTPDRVLPTSEPLPQGPRI